MLDFAIETELRNLAGLKGQLGRLESAHVSLDGHLFIVAGVVFLKLNHNVLHQIWQHYHLR